MEFVTGCHGANSHSQVTVAVCTTVDSESTSGLRWDCVSTFEQRPSCPGQQLQVSSRFRFPYRGWVLTSKQVMLLFRHRISHPTRTRTLVATTHSKRQVDTILHSIPHKINFQYQPISNPSPTSTIFSGDSPSNLNNASRSAFRAGSTTPMTLGTPSKKIVIRSDPAMVTCFDPEDKELYDLWAPKQ